MIELLLSTVRQLLLFGAVLTPLEILAPARAGWPRPDLKLDLAWNLLGPMMQKLPALLMLTTLGAVVEAAVPRAIPEAARALPFLAQFALIFVLSELLGYALHRLAHEIPWLWRLHAIHHSSERLDWWSAARQHPLESALMLGAANLPALALGFDTRAILGFIFAQKLYTAAVHLNADIGYGPLEGLLVSPRFHHTHHAATLKPGNFAHTLAILDRIFGTWQPATRLPERYGLDEPVPETLVGQILHPFRNFVFTGTATPR